MSKNNWDRTINKNIPALDFDIFENDVYFYISEFCENENIEDLKKEKQGVFNACLVYVHKNAVPYKNSFKKNAGSFNEYDIEKLCKLADVYIHICNKYNKFPTLYGFSFLSGVDYGTLTEWSGTGATSRAYALIKKLKEVFEASLVEDMAQSSGNVTGKIAIVNHMYGWQTTAAAAGVVAPPALTSQELPKLAAGSADCTKENIIE